MSCLPLFTACPITGTTIRMRIQWVPQEVGQTLANKTLSINFLDINTNVLVYDLSSNDLITDPDRIEIIDSTERIFDLVIEDSINTDAQTVFGDLIITDDITSEKSKIFKRIKFIIKKGT